MDATPISIHDPAWVAALATAVLALYAMVTLFYAVRAFRKQSAEVTLLKEQAGRDIEQRRRAQAAKVFITVGGLPPLLPELVRIHNTSDQPVYDLTASRAGAADFARLPCLMPGEEHRLATATDSELEI